MSTVTEAPVGSHLQGSSDAAEAHVKRISIKSGSSFLSGLKVLSQERRQAMYAIYAFCREVDDIADDPFTLAEKRRLLMEWREEIDRVFDGRPTSLTGQALANVVISYGLIKQDLIDLIDGMEMDADETATRGPNLKTLDSYCDKVASAVGRLSVRVFGDNGKAAQNVATSLGRALQLTNILRDLAEDAERGRLYLPNELLDRHAIKTRDPNTVLLHPNLPKVCHELSQIALGHYADAEVAIGKCSHTHIRPAVLMMHVYRRLLDGLIARGWKRLHEPVKVSKLIKLWILLRYGLL